MSIPSSPALPAPSLYPRPSIDALKAAFVGKQLKDIPAPAAVLDAAVVRKNCRLMLEAADKLGVGFRAHVKTHKTTEITELQVGEHATAVRLVCSTLSEIEHLLPWLKQCKARGKIIDVLYGLPLSLSQIPRLAAAARELGEGSIGVFVDHPSHIATLDRVDDQTWPGQIPVWINIDIGDHREGVTANSKQLSEIAHALQNAHKPRLAGLYTHMGSSYASNSPEDALRYMSVELNSLIEGAKAFLQALNVNTSSSSKISLSLGATPTATATQTLLETSALATSYRRILDAASETFAVEFHAGVYTVNDMQQLATRARASSLLSYEDLAFRILAEVASVYPDRTEKPGALIAAGSIVLGREPCKSYEGWGVVSPWPGKMEEGKGEYYDPDGERRGWIVGSVSQEHGVLRWEGSRDGLRELEVGEKLLVWPNHACIAGVSFGWYVVVDSELGDADTVRDVWLRCRGW